MDVLKYDRLLKDCNGGGYQGRSQNSHPIYGVSATDSKAIVSELKPYDHVG